MAPVKVEDEIAAALRLIGSPNVRTGFRRIGPDDERHLADVELAHVKGAVSLRRTEFASGRALLRQLLGQDVPISVGDDRAPQFPAGWCGSLAHDAEFAVGAVSDHQEIAAVGIDVEPAQPLDPSLDRYILRDDEPGIDSRLAFVLKEATYKAWSTMGGRMLDHLDVRVVLDRSTFRAIVLPDAIELTGRYARGANRWLALVVVESPARR